MAELDIGKHCAFASCKQLDFLPFTCTGCSGIFCLDHRSIDAHECSQVNISHDRQGYSGQKSFICSHRGCENKELTEIRCEHCQQNFCLSHRHQQDHACSFLEKKEMKMQETAKHIQNIAAGKEEKPTKSRGVGKKSKTTAAKVALMKIKQKAVGEKGIPETERIFLQVILPQNSHHKSKAMFFSKIWSIGRVIDKIASTVGLKNENNLAAGMVKKLRLFDVDTGDMLPVADSLDSLVQGEDPSLMNGGSVILEYVDSDCSKIHNCEQYSV